MANSFRLCSLLFYIAHQSFSLGCIVKTLPLLKNAYACFTSSGVAYTHICKVLISQHFNSCTRLSTSIINDPLHPLHPCLSKALSTSNTRSSFKLLRCRTSLYRNSLIPRLARLLVNPKQEVDLLCSNLS